MASLGLTIFNTYADSRSGSAADKLALKDKGEELYLNVYHELIDLVEGLGDADVAAKPGDSDLAARQILFKGWYADMRAQEFMFHQDINDRLEGAI